MSASPFSSTGLIDVEAAQELFGDQQDPEVTAMQREIWEGIRKDLEADLRRLAPVRGQDLKRELHRIRGYASTAALLRLGEILRAWERMDDVDAVAVDYLSLALDACGRSLSEMEMLHPHLVAQGGA